MKIGIIILKRIETMPKNTCQNEFHPSVKNALDFIISYTPFVYFLNNKQKKSTENKKTKKPEGIFVFVLLNAYYFILFYFVLFLLTGCYIYQSL